MEVIDITDEECIEIYKNNVLQLFNENIDHYDLVGYNFNGLTIDIVIYIDAEIDSEGYSFCSMNCFVYDNHFLLSGTILYEKKSLFEKEFCGLDIDEIITNIFKFLLHDFRKKFCYSKIIDEIVPIDSKKEVEKRKMAKLKLLDDKILENCCVCFEYNIFSTKCNHNVCRKCIEDIISKNADNSRCPLCREEL